MPSRKNSDLESIILNLLKDKESTTLPEIAGVAGLSSEQASDRRAIQRALTHLISRGEIEAKGQARARMYRLPGTFPVEKEEVTSVPEKSNADAIFLSPTTQKLRASVSEAIENRSPVGYIPYFLLSYEPNQTAYLSEAVRAELHHMGQPQNVMRQMATYRHHILTRLVADLAWNSSRLKGNTYSLGETKKLLEEGKPLSKKAANETQMIINHKEAIDYMMDSAYEAELTAHTIYSIHALLSDNLLKDAEASGRLREIGIGITGTAYLPLEDPICLQAYFDILITKMNQIQDPFECSFFAWVHLSYLHPFEGVNHRTARLLANIPLIKHRLCPLSFRDIQPADYALSLLGVYEKNDPSLMSDLYLYAYRQSCNYFASLEESLGETSLLRLQYRKVIQDIIRGVIVEQTKASELVGKIQHWVGSLKLSPSDSSQLFQMIDKEVVSLHEGNIARFKIRPAEFQTWKEGLEEKKEAVMVEETKSFL
jgi:hypothetical protein